MKQSLRIGILSGLVVGLALAENTQAAPLWSSHIAPGNWEQEWHIDQFSFGKENISVIPSSAPGLGYALHVIYPAGSWSHEATVAAGLPEGGAEFHATLGITPRDSLHLRYYLRFAKDFNFVKGGKLPGLCGGTANTGGNIPNGTDGFSVRLMWRTDGAGEAYAYTPDAGNMGISYGRGNWYFKRGTWQCVDEEVTLNTPGVRNGSIRIWIDQKLVLDSEGIRFRDVPTLKVDALLFSTFFGGSDQSWATPITTYIDFAKFSVWK